VKRDTAKNGREPSSRFVQFTIAIHGVNPVLVHFVVSTIRAGKD